MAFGTWFKNLLVKGKEFIKKASPYIRKGIEIARKIGPVFGGTAESIINGIANGADKLLDKISPIDSNKTRSNNIRALPFSDLPKQSPFGDVSDLKNNIEMISQPILGGSKGRLNPILK